MTLLLQDALVISPKTKQQVDKNTADIAKLQEKSAIAYHFKGSKPTFNDLPTTGNEVGDVWDVQDTGVNYAWTGTEWDELGPFADLEPYLTKEEATSTYLTQADATETYPTKTEVVDEISSIIIEGSSAPTSETIGVLGQLYKDTTTGLIYRCKAVDTTLPSYEWEELGSKVSGNFYRSLSDEQKIILLDTGNYDDEEVIDGEIFTTATGTFVQYKIVVENDTTTRTLEQLSYNKAEVDALLNQAYVTISWTIPLPLADWVENKQTFTIQGLNEDSGVDLNPVVPTTREEMIKLSNAGLFISALGENSVTIECMNLPTEDLVVRLKREMTTNLVLDEINVQLAEINGV